MGIGVVRIMVVWRVRRRGWLAGGGSSVRDQDNRRGRVVMMVVVGGRGRVVMVVVVGGRGRVVMVVVVGRPAFDAVIVVVLKVDVDMLSRGRRGRVRLGRRRRGGIRLGRRRWGRVDVHVVVLVGNSLRRSPHLEFGQEELPQELV